MKVMFFAQVIDLHENTWPFSEPFRMSILFAVDDKIQQ
jgi:hypothetical protein